jgi:hypothetical protein
MQLGDLKWGMCRKGNRLVFGFLRMERVAKVIGANARRMSKCEQHLY